MQISQHPAADSVELRLTGRLDATWADHVSDSIEATVRAGCHRIVLNFAGVNYISSLGIAVLLKHYQRLKAVNGSLVICEPSAATLKILNAAKLSGFLVNERPRGGCLGRCADPRACGGVVSCLSSDNRGYADVRRHRSPGKARGRWAW